MLDGALDNTPAREDRGRPRLPIDRVFTSAGFGTIATGTLIGGKLTIGLELEVQPGDITTRARGLQTHKSKVDVALPGSRVAINLAGLALTDLRRGQVVTIPGWLASTRAVDVSLRALPGAGPIAHNAPITFHTGSAETLGRVFLLDADEMAPGETAWAQIRLEEPVALAKGDLFVIRDTRETIGGGEIVEPHAKRHRRRQSAVIETLVSLQKGTPEELALRAADAKEPVALAQVVKASGLTNDVLQPEVAKLLADGRLLRIGESYLALSAWGKLRERAEETLTAYHKSFPLRIGMPREELKSKLGLPTKLYPIVLDKLIAKGAVAAHDTTIALAGFSVKLGAAEERKVGRLIERLSAERYSPSSLNELAVELNLGPELIAWLVESGRVKRLSDSIALLPEAYDDLTQGVVKLIKDRGSITVAEVRDLFGTSRKYALALVEHLDQRRITRREGDNRVLW